MFTGYLAHPQYWNRYSYALNNPLKYVDPDGLMSYPVTLLGQTVTVHIDDELVKNNPEALKRIQENLQKAFDKINAGYNAENPQASLLQEDQIESLHSLNGISVSSHHLVGMKGGTFQISPQMAVNPDIDTLSAGIIHDSRHGEQFQRGFSFSPETMVPMEMEASRFAVGVMEKIGTWNSGVVEFYRRDSQTGHISYGWKDKSTPKSRAKVFDTMAKPQPRRK